MYEPKVDDYVIWTTQLGMVHEGGYIFKCNQTQKRMGHTPVSYCTIEIGTKPKPYYTLTHDNFIRKFMCCFVVMSINGES